MFKKSISIILSIVIVMSTVTCLGVTVSAKSVELADEGATNWTYISTKEDFNNIRNNLSGNYKLKKNIVFKDSDFARGGAFYNSGKGFEPFDTFSGTFDGNGYTVSGIKITRSNSDSNALFRINNGVIKNANFVKMQCSYKGSFSYFCASAILIGTNQKTVDNCSLQGSIEGEVRYTHFNSVYEVGGIVGKNTSTINNCRVNIEISIYSQNSYQLRCENITGGGICGYNTSGATISNCTTNGFTIKKAGVTYVSDRGTTERNSVRFGGIVGDCGGTVINCINNADVTYLDDSYAAKGVYYCGIVNSDNGIRDNRYKDLYPNIVSSTNNGDIEMLTDVAGIGRASSGTFNACINNGRIQGVNAFGVVLGSFSSSTGTPSVTRCINNGEIDASQVAYGICYQGKNVSLCVNYGDVIGKWACGIGSVYGGSSLIGAGTMQRCVNHGRVKSQNGTAVGVAHTQYETTVTECVNYGELVGKSVFSIASKDPWRTNVEYDKVSHCYSLGKLTGNLTFHSIIAKNVYYTLNTNESTVTIRTNEKYNADILKDQERLEGLGFDFDTVWAIDPDYNNGYPYLQFQRENETNGYSNSFSYDYIPLTDITKNELQYPLYDETAYANQLQYWVVQNSDLFDAFSYYVNDKGVSFADMLEMTVDMPVFANRTGFSVGTDIKIKDMISYLVFADLTKKYFSQQLSSAKRKIQDGDIQGAYQDFFSAVKNYKVQATYLQQNIESDDGIDSMDKALSLLIHTKCAMEIINQLEYKNSAGMTIKAKSVSYLQDMYKAQVVESPEYYNNLEYYIYSGGDDQYLPESTSADLEHIATRIKEATTIYKIIKKGADMSTGATAIDIGIDELTYYANIPGNTTWKTKLKEIKKQWKGVKYTNDVLKLVLSSSILGAAKGAYDLSQDYINYVKGFYEGKQDEAAGFYALGYFYLGLYNPEGINALGNPSSSILDTGALYGMPFDYSNPIESSLAKYYERHFAGGSTLYAPTDEMCLYLYTAANSAVNMYQVPCKSYRNALLDYILAELNLRNGITGAPAKVYASANNADLGDVIYEDNDGNIGDTVNLTAQAKEGNTFVGWTDSNGQTVSADSSYQYTLTGNDNLTAVFAEGNVQTANTPVILNEFADITVYCGEEIDPVGIQIAPCNGAVEIDWFVNSVDSSTGGYLVDKGASFVPATNHQGVSYYYARVENTFTDPSGTETSAVTYSTPFRVETTQSIIMGLSVNNLTTRRQFFVEEELDTTRLAVFLEYSDGTKYQLDDFEVKYDFSKTGNAEIDIEAYGCCYKVAVKVVNSITQPFQEDENVTWTLDSNGTMTINGKGDIPPYVRWELEDYSNIIKEVRIEGDIQKIGFDAFSRLPNLQKVDLGNTVEEIEPMAFAENEKLTAIIIPESVTMIGSDAFAYTGITELTLPASVTTLDRYAFADCPYLEKVTILGEISELPYGLFSYCQKLEKVSIPNSVTAIQSNAFYNCTALKDIYFSGTEDQWNSISVTDDNKTILENVTVHHNAYMPGTTYGDADEDGVVSVMDATCIQRYLVGYTVMNPECVVLCGDILGDGLDITDATAIQRYLASYDDGYHIGKPIS